MTPSSVIVLGAGLAGAACAATLRAGGCSVCIVAPAEEVPNRGETLSPRAEVTLASLGWRELLDSGTALSAGDRYSVWGGTRLVRAPSPAGGHSGWHIDRRRLQDAVTERLELHGVERLVSSARAVRQAEDAVEVILSDGGTLRAAFLADCSGRRAVTAQPLDRRRLDRLTACHASFRVDDDVDVASATFVEAVADGWWYTAPGPSRCLTAAYFSDSDLLPPAISKSGSVWATLAAAAPLTVERLLSLGLSLEATTPHLASATTILSTSAWDRRVVRAGDAVAALDPLASNGLAAALWSGTQIAEGILGLSEGSASSIRRYESAILDGVLGQLRSQVGMYRAESRFRDRVFWSRRTEMQPARSRAATGEWA